MPDLAHWLVQNISALKSVPEDAIDAGIMVAVAGALLGLFMTVGGLMTYAERKIAAFTQSRIGPNRVGPWGLLQFLADGVKLILKEDLIPAGADRILFKMAPYAVVGGAFMVMAILPLGPSLIPVDGDLGVLVYLAASSFVTMGIVMSGWASNNKWSTMGAARSVAQIVSYEIPVGMSLLPAVLLTGSISFQAFTQSQGAYPWQWNLFHSPGMFLCAWCYFIAAMAEINRTPFDIPEAESELVSGYNTEYSGMRFGMFFVAEFANVMVISMIEVVTFWGGWHFPGEHALAAAWFGGAIPGFVAAISGGLIAKFVLFNLIGFVVQFAKAGGFIVLIILLRWTLPRVRVDQLMNICWKYLVPMTTVSVITTAAWMAFLDTGWWNYQPGGDRYSWNKFTVIGAGIMAFFLIRAYLESRYEWSPAIRHSKSAAGRAQEAMGHG